MKQLTTAIALGYLVSEFIDINEPRSVFMSPSRRRQ
jgi:hypothetical protein